MLRHKPYIQRDDYLLQRTFWYDGPQPIWFGLVYFWNMIRKRVDK